MKNVTAVDARWIAPCAMDTPMVSFSAPLEAPAPSYDAARDTLLCYVQPTFGGHKWQLPPHQMIFPGAGVHAEEQLRWFARFLLEGKVVPVLGKIKKHLNLKPSMITHKHSAKKIAALLQALDTNKVRSRAALRACWASNPAFLKDVVGTWLQRDYADSLDQVWRRMLLDELGDKHDGGGSTKKKAKKAKKRKQE